MALVKNETAGPRGAYCKGVLKMAEPGQIIEADDFSDGWFKEEKPASKPASKPKANS